jgi:hypothetical protein
MLKRKLALLAAALLAAFGTAVDTLEAQVPANFTGVSTAIYNSNALAPGYVFLASCGKQGDKGPFFLQIMNNDGTAFAYKQAGNITPGDDYYPYDFKVLPNGLLLNAQFTGWFSYIEGGTVRDELLDENLNVIETVQMGNGYLSESHDFELLPNGHILMVGYYTSFADLRSVRPTASPRAQVSGAVIQELDGNRNVVWQWRAWDHFNWNEFADWGAGSTDNLIAGWHVDAVRLDPIDGNLLVATTGEEMKINRQTGDVMWRLGGAFNQFSFVGVSAAEGLRELAGHDFHRLPSGNYILLNNGAADGSRTSQVHEFQLDEVNKVATHVWQYIPPMTIASSTRGNVQRLANGNTFIGWGSSTNSPAPDCTEITSDGTKIFELSFTNGLTDSYRAFRFVYPPESQRIESVKPGLAAGDTYNYTNVGVILNVDSLVADVYNSATVAREPFAPLYALFQGKAPRLLPVRISVSQTFIQSMSGVISFNPADFSIPDPTNTTVYYRATEGQGIFVPLPTEYDWVAGQLVARLSDTGFGEYAFGFADTAEVPLPPILNAVENDRGVQSNSVIAPLRATNGAVYTVNQQLPIALSWSPAGFAGWYQLQIAATSDFSSPTVDEPYLTDAKYVWNAANPGTTYFYRVKTWNDGGEGDWATNSFTAAAPFVHVTAPNGGESWKRGFPFFVQWNADLAENVTVALYKGALFAGNIVASTPNTGAYQWIIPANLSPGSDYSIRIASATNSAIFDVSDVPFSVVDTPMISPGSMTFTNGHLQFAISAPGAATATVLASSNLVDWRTVQTVNVTNDTAVFVDSAFPAPPRQFYRVQIP